MRPSLLTTLHKSTLCILRLRLLSSLPPPARSSQETRPTNLHKPSPPP